VSIAHAAAVAVLGQVTVSAGISSPSTTIDVPLTSLLPAVAVLSFLSVVGEPEVAEQTAVRPVIRYRWGLLLGLVAGATALLLAAGAHAGDADVGLVVIRNLIGFLGLSLLLRPWLGDAAWLCPSVFAAAELVFGGTAYRAPAGWAWTLQSVGSASALVVAGVAAVAGAAALSLAWGGRVSGPRRGPG
jgi:hypothetical protein